MLINHTKLYGKKYVKATTSASCLQGCGLTKMLNKVIWRLILSHIWSLLLLGPYNTVYWYSMTVIYTLNYLSKQFV